MVLPINAILVIKLRYQGYRTTRIAHQPLGLSQRARLTQPSTRKTKLDTTTHEHESVDLALHRTILNLTMKTFPHSTIDHRNIMVGVVETATPALPPARLGFSVSHQKVHLDIDLATRKLRGTTEITISPHSADLKTIRLNCRQCHLNRLSVNGKPSASMTYTDPFKQAKLRWRADVHQYHMLQERLEAHTKVPPDYELVVNLPKSIKIQELDPFSAVDSATKDIVDTSAMDSISNTKLSVDQIARFTPIIVLIDFTIDNIREGLHFVGWSQDDLRFPHVYSQKLQTSPSCSVFPLSRCF